MSNRRETVENGIGVSIICLAYNHKDYIEDALVGFVSQHTNFTFEVIVHDDASTDGTTEIIARYTQRYPELIKPIYEQENQYSKGMLSSINISMTKARGKYIAICEGDDYWTDAEKLQRQYDILEKYKNLSMCVCAGVELLSNGVKGKEIRPKTEDAILNPEETILNGGAYLPTAALFWRKELFENLMEFETKLNIDYVWQIKGALNGGIYYIDKPMVVYRKGTEGSWTERIDRNSYRRKKFNKKVNEMLRQLDEDTLGKYHETILKRIMANEPFYDQYMYHLGEIKKDLADGKSSKFLWGMGVRGEEFQKLCRKMGVELTGVCDINNNHIGEKTMFDYYIYDTSYVFEFGDIIIASNDGVVAYLKEKGYAGIIISLQKYEFI